MALDVEDVQISIYLIRSNSRWTSVYVVQTTLEPRNLDTHNLDFLIT